MRKPPRDQSRSLRVRSREMKLPAACGCDSGRISVLKWETLPSVCSSARPIGTGLPEERTNERKARLARTAGRKDGSNTGITCGAARARPLLFIFRAGCFSSTRKRVQVVQGTPNGKEIERVGMRGAVGSPSRDWHRRPTRVKSLFRGQLAEEQSETVHNDDDGAAFMTDYADGQWDPAHQRERDENGDCA